jgi:formylmethanofuran dehydrogenase subunit A
MERALEILADLAAGLDLTLTLEASPELLRLDLPEPNLFHLAALGPALTADDLVDAALGHLEQGTTADLGLISPEVSPAPGAQVDLGWFKPLDFSPRTDGAAARHTLALAAQYQGPNLAFSGAGVALAVTAADPRLFSRLQNADPEGPQLSLSRWVWMTRTLPARLLGLADRGHLTPGARADLALYALPEDAPRNRWSEDLSRCRMLLKAGEVVVEDFQVVRPEAARTCCYRRTRAESTSMVTELCQYLTLRPENLWAAADLGGPWTGLTYGGS